LGYTIKHEYAFVRDFTGYEFDAISFSDVFDLWQIPRKSELSQTTVHKILSLKLFLEAKGIDEFPFGELIIGAPIACICKGLQLYLDSISFPGEGKAKNIFSFCSSVLTGLTLAYTFNWYVNRPLKRTIYTKHPVL
jgi:hypothetical protein